MMQKLLEAPGGEGVGIDVVIARDAGDAFIFGPFFIEQVGLIVHGLRLLAKALDKRACMFRSAFDKEEKSSVGKALENRIAGIFGVDHLAQASARIADEVLVAVDLPRAFDEAGHIEKGFLLGFPMLGLPALVFSEGETALGAASGLAEIGRERFEVLVGEIGGDVDRIRTQEIAQEG